MFTKTKLAAAGFAAALSMAAGSASAATVMFTSNVISLQPTNFDSTLFLPQFDSSLGTLQSVSVTLFGNLMGTVQAESLDASPSTINTNLSSILTLSRPAGGGVIVITTPLAANSFNASAFDGTIDFAGTSGITYPGLTAMANNTTLLTALADLALFTGLGTVNADLSAVGASSANGAGNIVTQFNTQAGAYAEVTYTYATPGIPEPATWAFMIMGFGAAGSIVRRRRALALG